MKLGQNRAHVLELVELSWAVRFSLPRPDKIVVLETLTDETRFSFFQDVKIREFKGKTPGTFPIIHPQKGIVARFDSMTPD